MEANSKGRRWWDGGEDMGRSKEKMQAGWRRRCRQFGRKDVGGSKEKMITATQFADFLRHLRGCRKYIFFFKTLCEKVFLSAKNNANQVHSNCLIWWWSDSFALIIFSLNASFFFLKTMKNSKLLCSSERENN